MRVCIFPVRNIGQRTDHNCNKETAHRGKKAKEWFDCRLMTPSKWRLNGRGNCSTSGRRPAIPNLWPREGITCWFRVLYGCWNCGLCVYNNHLRFKTLTLPFTVEFSRAGHQSCRWLKVQGILARRWIFSLRVEGIFDVVVLVLKHVWNGLIHFF